VVNKRRKKKVKNEAKKAKNKAKPKKSESKSRSKRSAASQATQLKANANLLARFRKKLVSQDLSVITVDGYIHDLDYFFRWLLELEGHAVNVKKISAADLRAFRQEMVNIKRQKAASINRRIQALKRFFNWAVQQKLIRKNPAEELRFVKRKASTQPLALSKAEVHALLRVSGLSSHGLAKRNYAMLQLMLQAGLRISEVVKLQYRDIQVKERSGMVQVSDGKGLKEREVPLNATARRALLTYFKSLDKLKPKSPVFLSKQGSGATVRAIQLMVSSLARRAKVQRIKVSPHTLRHTFASNYLKANPGNLVELAALLGHESLNTTAIYTKASKEKLQQGVENSEINIYDD
jgi:integrase/recombinase XerC